MNKSLFYIVVVAALGGLLFGFDTGVISGCEQAIQNEFALGGLWHGLVISGALIGTVIGVFTAAGPSDRDTVLPVLDERRLYGGRGPAQARRAIRA